MPKLEVNVDKYIVELKYSFDEDHDMNENPEVSHIQDPDEKIQKANSWYESRLNQLDNNQQYALMDLEKAREAGYIHPENITLTQNLVIQTFDSIRQRAADRYVQETGQQPPIYECSQSQPLLTQTDKDSPNPHPNPFLKRGPFNPDSMKKYQASLGDSLSSQILPKSSDNPYDHTQSQPKSTDWTKRLAEHRKRVAPKLGSYADARRKSHHNSSGHLLS